MPWEALGNLDFHYKVLAIIGTLFTITSGTITIVWRIKTWHARRLKLLKEYLADREEDASIRRPALLKKIASSLHKTPPPDEPNVSRAVETAIHLLDQHHVSAAQTELENLQDRIKEKLDFIERYGRELTRHQANVHLFLAAIADRRNDATVGLQHISKAKATLGDDLEVLKYEGLLCLKQHRWTDARDAFRNLENAATGNGTRHYKAVGAKGRADALIELRERADAIDAYSLALRRIGEAEPQHRDPIFAGEVYLKLARLQATIGNRDALVLARNNASSALAEFRSTNGLGVQADHLREAERIRAHAEEALANTHHEA